MIRPMTAVVAAFATYYLALSIAREDGPGGVFVSLRNRYTDDASWIARGSAMHILEQIDYPIALETARQDIPTRPIELNA